MHRFTTLITSLCVMAGCRSPDHPAAVPTGPTGVTLTAQDYAFSFPDTVAAGWTSVRLVNHGTQPHMAQLIRLDPGRTAEEYLAAYGEAFRTRSPRPDWAHRLGGPTVTAPHDSSSATVYLEPGNYVWDCLYNLPDGVPHAVGHNMSKPFVVRTVSGGVESAMPAADVVMQLADYSFTLTPPLTPGRHSIRIENAGPEPHEVGLIRLADGKSMQDFLAWLANPGATPPDSVGKVVGGTTSFAPGGQVFVELDLADGEYLLVCFVTAPDGRSHIEHGMIQQISVRQ